MAIDATVGGISSNSYVTASEADVYFENHPYGSTWDGNEAMLTYATILLQSLVNWSYSPVSDTQALQFPVTVNGVDQTAIPADIINAQLELALYLQNNDQVLADNSLDSLKLGSIELDFNQDQAGKQELLPPLIQGMLSKWGTVNTSGSNVGSITLVRG